MLTKLLFIITIFTQISQKIYISQNIHLKTSLSKNPILSTIIKDLFLIPTVAKRKALNTTFKL